MIFLHFCLVIKQYLFIFAKGKTNDYKLFYITMNKMTKQMVLTLIAATIVSQPLAAQTKTVAESFRVSDVRLEASPFKHAEDMDIRYLLALDPDRLLAPYLKEAGLKPKADNYTNWENTGLDGHVGGHYLSALSFMWAATGKEDDRYGRKLPKVISVLRLSDSTTDGCRSTTYIKYMPDCATHTYRQDDRRLKPCS